MDNRVPVITQPSTSFVRRCRELAQGRGGPPRCCSKAPHLVEEALRARRASGRRVQTAVKRRWNPRGRHRGVQVFDATARVIEAASPVQHPAGLVAIARWQPRAASDLLATLEGIAVALVDVQDPGNVGGIIRSADALGAFGVLALDATARPGSWKALRAAMGSTFRLPIGAGTTEDLLRRLGPPSSDRRSVGGPRGYPDSRSGPLRRQVSWLSATKVPGFPSHSSRAPTSA